MKLNNKYLLLCLGTLNISATNNVSNTATSVKTPPLTAKNAVKDQKLFSSAKPIDPAWLAQTKIETANKLLVNFLFVFILYIIFRHISL